MAMICVSGCHECDGCMMCQIQDEMVATCGERGEPIYEGEDYYKFSDGEAVHDDCVLDYIREHYLIRG